MRLTIRPTVVRLTPRGLINVSCWRVECGLSVVSGERVGEKAAPPSRDWVQGRLVIMVGTHDEVCVQRCAVGVVVVMKDGCC